jgi:hypothetical protein
MRIFQPNHLFSGLERIEFRIAAPSTAQRTLSPASVRRPRGSKWGTSVSRMGHPSDQNRESGCQESLGRETSVVKEETSAIGIGDPGDQDGGLGNQKSLGQETSAIKVGDLGDRSGGSRRSKEEILGLKSNGGDRHSPPLVFNSYLVLGAGPGI